MFKCEKCILAPSNWIAHSLPLRLQRHTVTSVNLLVSLLYKSLEHWCRLRMHNWCSDPNKMWSVFINTIFKLAPYIHISIDIFFQLYKCDEHRSLCLCFSQRWRSFDVIFDCHCYSASLSHFLSGFCFFFARLYLF